MGLGPFRGDLPRTRAKPSPRPPCEAAAADATGGRRVRADSCPSARRRPRFRALPQAADVGRVSAHGGHYVHGRAQLVEIRRPHAKRRMFN